MRKYFRLLTTLGVLFLLVLLRNSKFKDDVTANIKPIDTTPAPTNSPTTSVVVTPTQQAQPTTNVQVTPTNIPQPTATPTPASSGMYKDGTYTGSVQDAYYGYVQVQVVIASGQITDVKFLQYPNDNPTSQYINSQAMPYLRQEAIQAQSANISGVSGASATSPAFQASLANALTQAKN